MLRIHRSSARDTPSSLGVNETRTFVVQSPTGSYRRCVIRISADTRGPIEYYSLAHKSSRRAGRAELVKHRILYLPKVRRLQGRLASRRISLSTSWFRRTSAKAAAEMTIGGRPEYRVVASGLG